MTWYASRAQPDISCNKVDAEGPVTSTSRGKAIVARHRPDVLMQTEHKTAGAAACSLGALDITGREN